MVSLRSPAHGMVGRRGANGGGNRRSVPMWDGGGNRRGLGARSDIHGASAGSDIHGIENLFTHFLKKQGEIP
jgi:hypothetical protein